MKGSKKKTKNQNPKMKQLLKLINKMKKNGRNNKNNI